MPHLGTRSKQSFQHNHPPEDIPQNSNTLDLGLSKKVTASVTFSASTARATAAAGTFANFAIGDQLVIASQGADGGFFEVIATDNSTYLTLDPPPPNGGPSTVTIRSI